MDPAAQSGGKPLFLPSNNFGTQVPTIAVPGAEILTTKANVDGAAKDQNGTYEIVTGTSAAAAVVSGVVGLIKSISFDLSPETIRRGLVQGARAAHDLKTKNSAGGVVSVSKALIAAGPSTRTTGVVKIFQSPRV